MCHGLSLVDGGVWIPVFLFYPLSGIIIHL
jgi:hypothetical protein